jgi:hypothetical protein
MRFLDFYIEGKYETIHCAMYSRRHNIYLRTRFDGWGGQWWEVLEVSKVANNFFQKSMFGFCSYMGFIVLLFRSKYPNFANSERLQQSIEFTRSITQRMGVVLCKDSWNNDWGKFMCCILVFCFVKWGDGVKEIGSCDLCGFENFEKKG